MQGVDTENIFSRVPSLPAPTPTRLPSLPAPTPTRLPNLPAPTPTRDVSYSSINQRGKSSPLNCKYYFSFFLRIFNILLLCEQYSDTQTLNK